jgi:hypothetical protein
MEIKKRFVRMSEEYNIDRSRMKALIEEFGGVDSYTTTQAVSIFELLFKMTREVGLDPEKSNEFFEVVSKVYNLEIHNLEKYKKGKYVFVPNHISEFDGLILGTILANMMVVAKTDWVSNPDLNAYIEKLFSIVGLHRRDTTSGLEVLRKCAEHLEKNENGGVTVFVQQTIAALDITTPEDIAVGVIFIAQKTAAPIVPVYIEQASVDQPTRIIFGEPMECMNKRKFGEEWLKNELELRAKITSPAARVPVLCEKHRKPIKERGF